MSHFTVLVIGDAPEWQLAPFHEFECTGRDDEFVQDIDVTQSLRDDFAKHNDGRTFAKFVEDWDGKCPVLWGEKPNLADTHKYGYALLDANGDVIKVIDRTNPNKKWDWHVLGGRWRGSFRLKSDGTKVDQARKGDIDWDGMRDAVGDGARRRYQQVERIFGGSIPRLDFTWESTREPESPYFSLSIDERREAYRSQAAMRALHELQGNRDLPSEDRSLISWLEMDQYNCDVEEYVARARAEALFTFAVLHNGQWFERGSMGWWGCVSDEKNKDAWATEFETLVMGLPDDTLLSVYDCHI